MSPLAIACAFLFESFLWKRGAAHKLKDHFFYLWNEML